MRTYICIYDLSRADLLCMRNHSDKYCRENHKAYIVFSNLFSESCAVNQIIGTHMVQPDSPQMKIKGDSLARGPKLLSNSEHRQMQVTGRAQYIAGRGPCFFPSLPVCVYKFSSHYLNNIIFYRQQFGASSEIIALYNTVHTVCMLDT